MNARRCCCISLLLLGAIGCAESDTAHAGFAVRDSAGVTLTESTGPAWAPEHRWTLTPTPELEIGRSSDDPRRQFHDVVGTAALPGGGVAVADRGSNTLRLFDSQGQLLATAGGEGQGPGEFRYILSMARSGGDSLLVMDETAIEVFSLAGDYLGSSLRRIRSSLLEEPDVIMDPLLVNPDGSVLAMVFEPRAGRVRPLHEPFRPPQGFALVLPGFEEAAFLGWYPGLLLERIEVGSGIVQLSPPFHTGTYVAGGGAPLRLVVGDSDVAEVRIFDASGHLIRVSRWGGRHRRAVEREWVELWKENGRNAPNARRREAQRELAWSRMHVPDRLPHFQALAVDVEGNVWIQASTAPTDSLSSYEVIDADGRWLGAVRVPPGLVHTLDHPVDIGEDYFLGTWQDELGIQSVRRYGLHKPGGSP